VVVFCRHLGVSDLLGGFDPGAQQFLWDGGFVFSDNFTNVFPDATGDKGVDVWDVVEFFS